MAEIRIGKVILADSSVLINILATKHAAEVLHIFEEGVAVCTAVEAETLYLRSEDPGSPLEPVSLQPLFDAGVLRRTTAENESEVSLYVELAADLDDGEAMALAIAHRRGLIFATDDRKARRIAVERLRHGSLLGTSDVMQMWVQATQPSLEIVKTALTRIQDIARFQPPKGDPLRDWWMALLLP